MVLCSCNSIADWLNHMSGTFKPRIPIWIGSGLAWAGATGIFLIGLSTLPAGVPSASAFLETKPQA